MASVGCGSTGGNALPGSLYGSWKGGNSQVTQVRFSSGGRIDINNGKCSGGYRLSAVDGNTGTVSSGYLECAPLMDGYFRVTVVVNGSSMNVTGDVIGGSYRRA